MSKRLFVSVDLDGLGEAVAPVQEHFEAVSGLNVVDPHQAHVTLKFLGDTDPDQVPELTDELAAAVDESGVEPFETELGGLGAFPSTDYIRVVWLGVREGGEQLTRLHEAIEERTVAMGFDPEEHDFTPHVTLARVNRLGVKWFETPEASRHHERAKLSRTTPRLVSGLPLYPRNAEGVKVPFAFSVPDLRAS
ncbi:RNA 2',3'-cyclic phosphodiesterase [Halorhabdus sp. CBA1104]|uniref:RNA 2',3'-cyclic phosphodiesterase n=1 Tax=Halorhabdus sp. CBA1104 TaxID=1380432 RepID=UPI0012B2E0CA|nr:RNA 2',3'-cyclic phosphodiesterase [Halorhabdus sp. CBA1104]QGN07408.1 RNA 2',3'-cyclic phosphodiesterase [Halorhabdus sp. CBA1104]